MNKKFLSAILFGALMVTSTGTFVSCKDYDEDIDGLQTQVDSNKSAIEAVKGLQTQVTALQSALTTAQSTADAAKTAAANAATAAEAAKKAGEAAAAQAKADAIAAAIKEANDLKAWVEAQGYLTKDDLAALNGQAAAVLELSAKIEAIEAGLSTLDTDIKQMYAGIQEQIELLTSTSVNNIVTLQEELALQQATLDIYEEMLKELQAGDEELWAEIALARQELAGAISSLNLQLEEKTGELWEEVALAKQELYGAISALTNIQADDKKALEEEIASVNKTLSETLSALITIQGEDKKALEEEIASVNKTLSETLSALANIQADDKKALEEEIALVNKTLSEAFSVLNNAVAENTTEIANLWEDLTTAKGELSAAITNVLNLIADLDGNLVTLHSLLDGKVVSVDIQSYSSSSTYPWCPTFFNTIEKAAVFGDKTAIKANENLTFTAGKLHAGTTEVDIRVSPTNVQITKEQITLINSLGGNLNDYVEVAEVKPYNKLLHGWNTRSAVDNKSGMWTVSFRLKETTDVEEFLKAVTMKDGDNTYGVKFAVAVDNVISAHSLEFDAKELVPANKLDFFVNDKNIENIANRYATYTSVEEMKWKGDAAVAAILTPAKDKNVVLRADAGTTGTDYRPGAEILPVVKGEEIAIRINATKNGNEWVEGDKIAGFYVTLDKAYALESAVSEINAWNSYEYENVGTDKQAATMFKGNYGTITIKNLNNVVGDVIGFRVYAVNLNGTLMDPDGRAFYVSVGNPAATAQTISATITPKATTETSVTVELTAAQSALITSLLKDEYEDYNTGVVMSTANAKIEGVTTEYGVDYVWNDDNTAVVKVTFTLNDVTYFIDDETYKASTTFYSATKHELGTVNFELTKTMPTAFPEAFAFRPKQEVEDGTGKFIAYMIPNNGYAAASEKGTKDLNNVFYGLDANYEFIFATSATKKQNNQDVVVDNEVIADDEYVLEVAKSFINNETWHNVTVNYLYKGISTYYDAEEEEYVKGDDHKVAYGKTLQVKYACWHNASAFDWAKKTATKTYKPELQWMAEGNTVYAHYAHISSTNSYNNDYFGLDLNELLNTKGWLKVKEGSAKLTVNGQVNPYFKPEFNVLAIDEDGLPVQDEDGNSVIAISFTQVGTQIDAAPVADHEENLEFVVVDAYGHEKTISLAVTIKAPNKK